MSTFQAQLLLASAPVQVSMLCHSQIVPVNSTQPRAHSFELLNITEVQLLHPLVLKEGLSKEWLDLDQPNSYFGPAGNELLALPALMALLLGHGLKESPAEACRQAHTQTIAEPASIPITQCSLIMVPCDACMAPCRDNAGTTRSSRGDEPCQILARLHGALTLVSSCGPYIQPTDQLQSAAVRLTAILIAPFRRSPLKQDTVHMPRS